MKIEEALELSLLFGPLRAIYIRHACAWYQGKCEYKLVKGYMSKDYSFGFNWTHDQDKFYRKSIEGPLVYMEKGFPNKLKIPFELFIKRYKSFKYLEEVIITDDSYWLSSIITATESKYTFKNPFNELVIESPSLYEMHKLIGKACLDAMAKVD